MWIFWLNTKDIMKDIVVSLGSFSIKVIKSILNFFVEVFNLARNIVYRLLCIAYKIGCLLFLVGIYLIYNCYIESKTGIEFIKTSNFSIALLFLFIPIAISVIREFIKPKRYN